MKWITREHPKIDRIACPWLIKRFIDQKAEIIYVPYNEVLEKSKELGATPFDIPGVELTHYKDQCTFDYILKKYKLKDPALHIMAPIIRAADTDAQHLSPQSSGLWAISAGMAYNFKDDHELLGHGMVMYDALYSWAKFLQNERHTENPIEHLLLDVFHKYLKPVSNSGKKIPAWAKELREIIQDQIDINLNLSLKDVSEELNIHPAYLSREFSKHFENLSFGDYIRKMRIEKAITMLDSSAHSLSEIAYLTGFSDQSHFTRIFKKHTGESPSDYRKNLKKGKNNPNS